MHLPACAHFSFHESLVHILARCSIPHSQSRTVSTGCPKRSLKQTTSTNSLLLPFALTLPATKHATQRPLTSNPCPGFTSSCRTWLRCFTANGSSWRKTRRSSATRAEASGCRRRGMMAALRWPEARGGFIWGCLDMLCCVGRLCGLDCALQSLCWTWRAESQQHRRCVFLTFACGAFDLLTRLSEIVKKLRDSRPRPVEA
jgi:hypothetical protein